MAKQVMPPARLETRPADLKFTEDLLLKISLFSQLKRKPSLDKFPGTLVLRHFKKGETICSQGEAGWTAFYILTTEDAAEYYRGLSQIETGSTQRNLQRMAQEQAARLAEMKEAPGDSELRKVATVRLTMAGPQRPRPAGLRQRLFRWLGRAPRKQGPMPAFIPIDAPTEIDSQTMSAPLYEGELFGEMSCRIGAPRPATIVADRDCSMLEMLRNIFDQLQKDAAYKARTDEVYKKRRLQFQRKLSIFAELTDTQFEAIRDRIDLLSFDPGQIIYDEHERSDSVYLIQHGMVRVLKKASVLLGPDQVRDGKALAQTLASSAQEPASPRQRLWELLSESARAACQQAADSGVTEALQIEILRGLNAILKGPLLDSFPEFTKIAKSDKILAKLDDFPETRKEWSEQEQRQFNRLLLDVALETPLRSYRRRVGPDCVLYYCAGGEFIGEQSMFGQAYRSETCLAQGHPKDAGSTKDAGPVEVVRVPADLLKQLISQSPTLNARIERVMAERRRRTQEQVRVPVWDDSREVLLSDRFQRLGLIQGQRLMLIDLDRCTRCDECVRACVDTHDDGQTRLFLDGPHFGKYLIPTSCRSCLDPVCMVGCPVGSIHRGNNGQIVIEDWCIGCGLCSQQCPYGSIRMNDIAVIPEAGHGWRYIPESAVGSNQWTRLRFRDRRWIAAPGPFANDRVFRESLAAFIDVRETAAALANLNVQSIRDINALPSMAGGESSGRVGQPVFFRYPFQLTREQMGPDRWFKLTVVTKDPAVQVWVNGQELTPDGKPSGDKREYSMPRRPAGASPATREMPRKSTVMQQASELDAAKAAGTWEKPIAYVNPLRAGGNLLAVRVAPDTSPNEKFLTVRMDEVRKPTVAGDQDVTQKLVTERAVVCDLCSSQMGQVPACVNACPHDAAMRIDARSDFPMG